MLTKYRGVGGPEFDYKPIKEPVQNYDAKSARSTIIFDFSRLPGPTAAGARDCVETC